MARRPADAEAQGWLPNELWLEIDPVSLQAKEASAGPLCCMRKGPGCSPYVFDCNSADFGAAVQTFRERWPGLAKRSSVQVCRQQPGMLLSGSCRPHRPIALQISCMLCLDARPA